MTAAAVANILRAISDTADRDARYGAVTELLGLLQPSAAATDSDGADAATDIEAELADSLDALVAGLNAAIGSGDAPVRRARCDRDRVAAR